MTADDRADTALVVIDMQEIFRDPDSQWCVSTYDLAADAIRRLTPALESPVIWTRFVRDPQEQGSWGAYYEHWDRCRLDPDAAEWGLTLPVGAQDHVLTAPTFSKWGPELAGLTAGRDHLVVCGVATDCCVLSTVLGAVDAGKRVTVVADACGGATPQAHVQALALLELLAPMVDVVGSADLLRPGPVAAAVDRR